jgi:uncharacterized membrane-anchored protein YjiN (DUF445 family)
MQPDKAEALRGMQLLATACIAAAFALRIGAGFLPNSIWVGYLRAASEAAVVGGMADWFAVTALFRHPLGLPIPHTRILPRGKDRIATSLSGFIVTNFLTPEVVERELAGVDLSAKGAEVLFAKADVFATRITEYLPRILSALDGQDICRFLAAQVTDRLRTVAVAPIAGRLIDLLTSGDKHERIVNDLLKLGEEGLRDNHDVLTNLIRKELPMPDSFSVHGLPIPLPLGSVKDVLAGLIAEEAMRRIMRTIGQVRENPRHEIRARIRERIALLAKELQESPEMQARGEDIKAELLSNPNVTAYASHIWSEIKAGILTDVSQADSRIRNHLANAIRRAAQQVKTDDEIREKFNASLRSAAINIISNNAPQFARIIEETVDRWDGEEFSRKLELEVGRDLQFVRLNGTLVGGLLGAALHFLTSRI